MITAIVIGAILALALALVIAIALEPGPSPSDVAVAYEEALDRHDARTLWGLVAPELRGPLRRRDYVREQERLLADRPSGRIVAVEVEDEFAGRMEASVLTIVRHHDGTKHRRRTRCVRHHGAWRVRSVSGVSESGPTTDISPSS